MANPFDNLLDAFGPSLGGAGPILPGATPPYTIETPEVDYGPSTIPNAMMAGKPGALSPPPGIDLSTGTIPPLNFGPGAQPSNQALAYRNAMGQIEGNYNSVTNTGRGYNAVGRYQVIEPNIPEWTRRWYGRALTSEEFRNNPQAQDAVFDGQFGEYVQRFGGAEAAAQAWLGGPGNVGRNDVRDRFGTTPVGHGRNFMSALSQGGVPNQQPVALAPGLAGDLGLTTGVQGQQPQQPVSPTASAMAPGLSNVQNQRQPGLIGQFLNQIMGPTPAIAGGYLDYVRGAPAANEIDLQRQQAAAEIFTRGQELQAQNPGAQPQQIAQLLIRDPVWGKNAIRLGMQAGAALQAAVTPQIPPTTTLSPGQQQFQLGPNGQYSPTGAAVPPTPPPEMQLFQMFQQASPQDRSAMMDFFNARRANAPSDREQAIARIQAAEARNQPPSIDDLQLAGYIQKRIVQNQYGGPSYEEWYNTRTGQPLTQSGPSQIGTGPGPAQSGPGATSVPPPAGAAPGPTLNMNPQVIGMVGNRNIVDVPDLSLNTTTLDDPAYMALGAGPIAAFRGQWGRIVGNLPGIAATEEETLNRQNALQQLRSSFAAYRKGARLAGEHHESMAEIPDSISINTNPLRAVNQLISNREQLIRALQLAEATARDPGLAAETRRTASNSVAEIRGVLLRHAPLVNYYRLAEKLRGGQEIPGAGIPNFSEMFDRATSAGRRAASSVTGQDENVLPENLDGYDITTLQRLSTRKGLSQEDAKRLRDAMILRMRERERM